MARTTISTSAAAISRDDPPDDDAIREALRRALDGGATKRDAVADVARELGVAKKQVYALAIAL